MNAPASGTLNKRRVRTPPEAGAQHKVIAPQVARVTVEIPDALAGPRRHQNARDGYEVARHAVERGADIRGAACPVPVEAPIWGEAGGKQALIVRRENAGHAAVTRKRDQ
ncbi:MAG: hypothetical protein Q8J92_02815 [Parvibaculum sp.]|nr:hypothetical protein [Parvibaculum sp.]